MPVSPSDRLRELATRWRTVRMELDVALQALDEVLWLDQNLPKIMMGAQGARALAAELCYNLEHLARELERTTLLPK